MTDQENEKERKVGSTDMTPLAFLAAVAFTVVVIVSIVLFVLTSPGGPL